MISLLMSYHHQPFQPLLRETKAERRAKGLANAQKKHALWTEGESSLLDQLDYVPTIGLEVHAQIKSQSKLFSTASTLFNHTQPNSHISHIDVALPGSLPLLNEYCVRQAVKTSLALNGQVQPYSQFDRKHYFYPDMPQGYQITQQFYPLMLNGHLYLQYNAPDATTSDDMSDHLSQQVKVTIQRLQIEQDSGKSMHDISFEERDMKTTLVDLNRAGIALMEIITGPDLHSTIQVEQFLKRLQFLLRHIGTCDGNMEEGNMRCDVNVSVAKRSSPTYGVRCEIKNVTSFSNVCKAIDYEVKRQIQVLEAGGTIEQETRAFDAKTSTTVLMRSKENAPDYRFFPDPDLPPLRLTQEYIERIRSELPELPDQVTERMIKQYPGLTVEDVNFLFSHDALTYFEGIISGNRDAKMSFNLLSAELFGLLNKDGKTIAQSPVSSDQLSSLVECVQQDLISSKTAKRVLQILYESGDSSKTALDIVNENNWRQITDQKQIMTLCEQTIASHRSEVEKYLTGNARMLSFLVGQVVKATDGMVNPLIATDIMKSLIENQKQ